MKQILNLIILALAFVGFIGGIGYTVMNSAYLITVGIAVLGYTAYPKIVELIKTFK